MSAPRRPSALVLVLCLAAPVYASNEEAGFGARAIAMADSLVADPGLSAFTLNPAALGHVRQSELLAGIRKLNHISAGPTSLSGFTLGVAVPFQNPTGGGVAGIFVIYDENADIALERTIGFTYATRSWREIGPGTLDIGASIKSLSRTGRAVSGAVSKAAVDVGTYYRWGEDKSVGVALLNVNGPDTGIQNIRDKAPTTFKLGYAQRVRRFMIAMDFTKREGSRTHRGTTSFGIGVEHAWGTHKYGSLFARSGLILGGNARSWSLGGGWSVYGTKIDYAIRIPVSNGKTWSHVISLSYRFGDWNPETEYERLLTSEIKYRKDLSHALEAAEIKQWKLAEGMRLLNREMRDLRRELALREVEKGQAEDKLKAAQRRLKFKSLEQRRRQARRRLEATQREAERIRLMNKAGLLEGEMKAYRDLKAQGVSELVLVDRLRRILRQFQGQGVDLGPANKELQRLMKSR